MAPGATTSAGPIPRYDITTTVFKLQQHGPKAVADLASLPAKEFQGAMGFFLTQTKVGSLSYYFDDLSTSVKGETLLKLLLEQGFSQSQATTALLYLYSLKQTPGANDNQIHMNLSDLRAAASNTDQQMRLYSLLKDGVNKFVQRITQPPKTPPAVAPGLGHNPAAMSIPQTVSLDPVMAPSGGTVVHNPLALLSVAASYIDDPDPGRVISEAGGIVLNGQA